MSATSDLSSILTDANWTMYQIGALEPQPAPPSVSVPVMRETQPATAQFTPDFQGSLKWYQVAPQYWTKQNVLEWISFHVEESKFDASTLTMANCSVDGPFLCQLSHESLVSMYGSLGDRLYQHLLELKAKYGADDLDTTYDLLNNLFDEFPEFLNVHGGDDFKLLSTVIVHEEENGKDGLNMMGGSTPLSDNGYESGSTSPDSLDSSNSGMVGFLNPSSPEYGGSDSDPELTDLRFHHTAKGFIKTEEGELKACKRRGRPRKSSRSSDYCIEAKKNKHSQRGAHLWEFIRDILIHPEQNNGLMRWEDRREGCLQVPQVRGCGPALGPEEEEQQHDL
ncbi:hypothetical protein MATL_G00071590 [Megalops atlanticus]|uniref:PNT domain-containing protein n=1 Tax=Megalops atlanticus TaxID=7932 RepID=A0A9D3Q4E1_MEGAT|nr:hypothetical protein MATL_G00071590 [Megalops atlanticus]